MLTIILSYFEEKKLLEAWLLTAEQVLAQNTNIRFIFVDDCSLQRPALVYFPISVHENISLIRISSDHGYNMYAARNLAMMQSTTKWNLLCNIGVMVDVKSILSIADQIANDKLIANTVYQFDGMPLTKNNFLIHADTFWAAGGYDIEWAGRVGGQNTLLERIQELYHIDTISDAAAFRNSNARVTQIVHTDKFSYRPEVMVYTDTTLVPETNIETQQNIRNIIATRRVACPDVRQTSFMKGIAWQQQI